MRRRMLIDATDALVRVARAAICGSDLWPYKSMPHVDGGQGEAVRVPQADGTLVVSRRC